jgi:hypothetical protein
MKLELTVDENTTVARAVKHFVRNKRILRQLSGEQSPEGGFTGTELDEIQNSLASEALITDGILCGDAYNLKAQAWGAKVHALLQRLQSIRR